MEPTSDEKMWAGCAYLGQVCCLIPTIVIFLMKKDESSFIKFQSLQSIALWLANFIVVVVLLTLSQIPGIGMVFGMIQMVFSLAFLGYWLFLMIQTFMGKDVEIPYVGDFIRSNLMN